MLSSHIPLTRLGRSALLLTLIASRASAQAPTPPPTTPPGAAPAPAPAAPVDPGPPTPEPSAPPTEGAPPPEPSPTAAASAPAGGDVAADLAALKAELADTKQKLEQVQTRQDDAEAAAALGGGGEAEAPHEDVLKIYGFTDMGVQRQWAKDASLLAHVFQTNSTSFVIGNVNVYFDAQPIQGWRGLVEVRFTNAPLGDVESYGGLTGTPFSRKDTFSYDPHGTAINAPMWAGALVLERAWVEWNDHQSFKLRAGNWFTPFGIWNEDHGSPTLISMALPQFILQQWIPIRQTGLMAYGNAFAGEWELGYTLTLSNGRQEISNFNFDDKFGFGGRVYARRDTGALNSTFGLSYFTGTTSDEEVNVTGIAPVTFTNEKTWEYNEHVLGADISLDIESTRIRTEAMVRRQTYSEGLRPPGDPIFAPGSVVGDKWQYSAYLLLAHQLPWAGIEPFLWTELLETPGVVADGVFVGSVGVNVHFNPAVQWKTQLTRAVFFDWLYDNPGDASTDNLTALYSRLVMAF
jgi:outer membrane biosynthesis protein TonB